MDNDPFHSSLGPTDSYAYGGGGKDTTEGVIVPEITIRIYACPGIMLSSVMITIVFSVETLSASKVAGEPRE